MYNTYKYIQHYFIAIIPYKKIVERVLLFQTKFSNLKQKTR